MFLLVRGWPRWNERLQRLYFSHSISSSSSSSEARRLPRSSSSSTVVNSMASSTKKGTKRHRLRLAYRVVTVLCFFLSVFDRRSVTLLSPGCGTRRLAGLFCSCVVRLAVAVDSLLLPGFFGRVVSVITSAEFRFIQEVRCTVDNLFDLVV